jgi:hypothetical protein
MPVRPVVLIPLLVVAAFTFAACSSTFLVTKDGKSYFFGSGRTEMRAMLCDSGDLMRVLTDTDLDVKVRHTLYIAMCVEPSREKVREVYVALSKEERRDLRLAFQKHGYEINRIMC